MFHWERISGNWISCQLQILPLWISRANYFFRGTLGWETGKSQRRELTTKARRKPFSGGLCDTRPGYSTVKALFLWVSHSCNCNLSFLIFSWFKISCDDRAGVDENWDCSQFNDPHYFAGSCHTNLKFHNSQTMIIKKMISPIIPSFIGQQSLSSTHTKTS